MSEFLGARYQNALRYSPGRTAGVYLDGRAVPDFGVQQVTSRAPVQFDPFMGQVAQFGQGQTQFTSDGSDARAPGVETDYLALAARYGPQVLRAANQVRGLFGEEEAAINSFENLTPYSAPVAGPGVIDSFQNSAGGFGDSFVSGQGGAAAGAFTGGTDFAQGAVIDSFQNTVAPAAVDAAAGAAAGGLSSSLLSSGLNAGAGAIGSYAGQYLGGMINNGRVDGAVGGQVGAALGTAVGGFAGPIGSLVGAYFGGLLGSQLGPKPDFSTTYASARLGIDGQFTGGGEMRNGGSVGVGNDLFNISNNYFAQRAAAEGYAPNLAQAGNGYWFGAGQGEDGFGGFFLQPVGPDRPDIRPDNFALYTGGTEAYGLDGPRNLGTDPRFRQPADFGEALDAAYSRLVDWGYFAPQGSGPSQADVAANFQAQQNDYFSAYPEALSPAFAPDQGGPRQPSFAYNPDFQSASLSGLDAYGRPLSLDGGFIPTASNYTVGFAPPPEANG